MHRFWRGLPVYLATSASAVLTLAACSTGPARVPLIVLPETGNGSAQIESNTLRLEAEALVRISFSQAILVEVIATPSGGTAETAADLTTYEFRFAADRTNLTAGTVWITATNGRFGTTLSSSQRLTDVTFAELPQSVTLERAVSLMREGGFTDAFRRVILRQLPGGAAGEPTYAFDMSSRFILVGAITGTVSQTTSQPEPNRLVPSF